MKCHRYAIHQVRDQVGLFRVLHVSHERRNEAVSAKLYVSTIALMGGVAFWGGWHA